MMKYQIYDIENNWELMLDTNDENEFNDMMNEHFWNPWVMCYIDGICINFYC